MLLQAESSIKTRTSQMTECISKQETNLLGQLSQMRDRTHEDIGKNMEMKERYLKEAQRVQVNSKIAGVWR